MPNFKACAALLALTVIACDERATPFAGYQRVSDGVASKAGGLLGFPCSRKEIISGITVDARIPDEQCYKLRPAQRYKGIWLNEFEGSLFFENASTPAEVKSRYRALRGLHGRGKEWLTFSEKLEPSFRRRHSNRNSSMFLIDVIGRRAAHTGRYGHMGASESLMIVDRINDAKFIYLSPSNYLADDLGK
jgi:hypothetical protein